MTEGLGGAADDGDVSVTDREEVPHTGQLPIVAGLDPPDLQPRPQDVVVVGLRVVRGEVHCGTSVPRGALGILGRQDLEVTYATAPWHFLYFLPLPQGQGALRPTLSLALA